jgi:hypothetical protein
MAFCGKLPVRLKLILDNQPIEQFARFKHLGCQLSYQGEIVVNYKLEKFSYMCGTVQGTSKNKTKMEREITFYKVMAICAGLYGNENWVLTEEDKNKIQEAEMRSL